MTEKTLICECACHEEMLKECPNCNCKQKPKMTEKTLSEKEHGAYGCENYWKEDVKKHIQDVQRELESLATFEIGNVGTNEEIIYLKDLIRIFKKGFGGELTK